MKLYDCEAAPNPRRVRIFIAEKGISIPRVPVDLLGGEQFSDAYRAINPACVVPALVLDDGTVIGEVPAICGYLEQTFPDPPLIGTEAKERAVVTMWDRRAELGGLLAVADGFRNGARGLHGRALTGPRGYDQIPALVDRGKARTLDFYQDMDERLAESAYVGGDRFSIADITAVVTVDFATRGLKVPMPESFASLRAWYQRVAARPSMSA